MKTRAAVLYGIHQDWKIEEIRLDPPKEGEVLVEWKAAGICHSDEHMVTGDTIPSDEMRARLGLPDRFPFIGGHEGAGVVREVGPGVATLEPGDHITVSFVPACGRCQWCVTGRSNICDNGAAFFLPGQISDGTFRYFLNGEGVNVLAKVGTFAEHGVIHELSAVKVDPSVPLTTAALVSCGVVTGFGSAVSRAEVKPGETVVVVGVGGVGINAVQGARIAGARNIVAVDPVEFKQKVALDLGATHSVASMAEALPLVKELTWGRLADSVIITVSVLHGDLLPEALALTGKGGTCVATSAAPLSQTEVKLNLYEFTMWQKELRGSVFGASNPRYDIPNLLGLYRAGQLKLDELVTRTYALDQINEGFADLRDGKNIRGVITY